MTDQITIPDTSEGLEELLHDPAKVKAVFSQPDTLKAFLAKHADLRNAKDAELEAQAREQMQLVLAEFLRNNGGQGTIPAAALAGKGRPGFTGPGPAPGSMAHRQSLYSKAAHGAQRNGAFETMGDFFRAITQEGAGRQYRDAADLNARLDKVKAIQNAFSTDVPSDGWFLVP